MATKICRVCGLEKPLDELVSHKQCTFGCDALCKQCKRASDHCDYVKNREAIKARSREWKLDNPEKVRESNRRFTDNHPDKIKEYARKYRATHHEQRIEASRKYNSENREVINARHRARYSKNAARIRQWQYEHPDQVHRYKRNWRKSHLHKLREYSHQRRALKVGAEGTHDYADELAQLKRQKRKCYYCHEKIIGRNWHADHVVPLSRGGSNWPDNIVIACPRCNESKRDKMPHEFSKGGRLL